MGTDFDGSLLFRIRPCQFSWEQWISRAAQVAPSLAIYRELSMLESELNENINVLKFTSAQTRRLRG
jgi:hypothetical protein